MIFCICRKIQKMDGHWPSITCSLDLENCVQKNLTVISKPTSYLIRAISRARAIWLSFSHRTVNTLKYVINFKCKTEYWFIKINGGPIPQVFIYIYRHTLKMHTKHETVMQTTQHTRDVLDITSLIQFHSNRRKDVL